RRFLFVGTPELHPVAVGDEHGVEVLDAAEAVAEGRLAHDADESRRVSVRVAVQLVFGRSWRGLKPPRVVFRARAPGCRSHGPDHTSSNRPAFGASRGTGQRHPTRVAGPPSSGRLDV